MTEVPCQKRRRVIRISADGSKHEAYRCAGSAAQHYRKDVSKVVCEGCPLRRPMVKPAGCKEVPPKQATWSEPYYNDGDLIYPFVSGIEQPPCPQGFKRKSTSNWQFESKWQPCDFRQFMNIRAPKGDLQVKAVCEARQNTEVSFDNCNKCLTAIEQIGGESPKFPGVIELVGTYWKAIRTWIAAGRPVRDATEVKRIHSDFCVLCDWYDLPTQRCKGCGCQVKAKGVAVLNKIKMETEHCPRKLW